MKGIQLSTANVKTPAYFLCCLCVQIDLEVLKWSFSKVKENGFAFSSSSVDQCHLGLSYFKAKATLDFYFLAGWIGFYCWNTTWREVCSWRCDSPQHLVEPLVVLMDANWHLQTKFILTLIWLTGCFPFWPLYPLFMLLKLWKAIPFPFHTENLQSWKPKDTCWPHDKGKHRLKSSQWSLI